MCKEEGLSAQITAIEAVEQRVDIMWTPSCDARGWAIHNIVQMQVGAFTNTSAIAKLITYLTSVSEA